MNRGAVRRTLTVGSSATPLDGCCDFFSPCSDGIMSLHFGGVLEFLDWLGWSVTEDCKRVVDFIQYNRAERQEDGTSPTAGYISNACADPNGIEYASCTLDVEDFGRYGRRGDTREMIKATRYCKTRPTQRLDGKPVTDETEWDLKFVTQVILQDIMRHIITGSSAVGGQFGGLEEWVATTYACQGLDSAVIDWNGNTLAGGAGITWNGAAVGAAYSFYQVIRSAFRNIRRRIKWAPMLATQQQMLGDMIILAPTHVNECILDNYVCDKLCAGTQYDETVINTHDARDMRDKLVADVPENLYGAGFIRIDGTPVPLMDYDFGLIKGPTLSDAYLLTGKIGNQKIWEGEHLSATEAARKFSTLGYFTSDGGRMLGKYVAENECEYLKAWMHPRLWCLSPWAQVRIQNVKCTQPGPILSGDPEETSFFITSSFEPAECT